MCWQALAREAGEGEDNAGELSALNDEADMPLEQLLARYGYVIGSNAAYGTAHGAAGTSSPPAVAAAAGQCSASPCKHHSTTPT